MTKTDKFLRRFIAQEIVALIERIDATDYAGDSSYHAAKHLLREGRLSFIERKLLSSALSKVARRETLVRAMNVVVYNNIEGEVHHSNAKQSIYDTAQNAARQNAAMQGGILQSAAQNAWERQLGQNAVQQNQLYAQQADIYGVLR
jgi:hypothetical protein